MKLTSMVTTVVALAAAAALGTGGVASADLPAAVDTYDNTMAMNGVDLFSDPAEDALMLAKTSFTADDVALPQDHVIESCQMPTVETVCDSISTGSSMAAVDARSSTDVHTYYYDSRGTQYLMRWGTERYGYRHIKQKHGWNSTMDYRIDWTLDQYDRRTYQNSAIVFYKYVKPNRKCLFKVVYETRPYEDDRPKGVITAYAQANSGC